MTGSLKSFFLSTTMIDILYTFLFMKLFCDILCPAVTDYLTKQGD
jgi:hypothetical protein